MGHGRHRRTTTHRDGSVSVEERYEPKFEADAWHLEDRGCSMGPQVVSTFVPPSRKPRAIADELGCPSASWPKRNVAPPGPADQVA